VRLFVALQPIGIIHCVVINTGLLLPFSIAPFPIPILNLHGVGAGVAERHASRSKRETTNINRMPPENRDRVGIQHEVSTRRAAN
jgi:hypothetical protein